ncbi:DUF6474 family protein [Gordonia sp. L191]|uniref:DUF6474 family protein n=1 Tax=Gordonia sp. L191 TaxID=2982699 RepID=UPI0024C0AFD8|nr:DUF6474 family protein [Gordonia sp. L191]WHU46685.1 DUF6474 family protein [Gordonia sp. L191]
MGVFSSDGRSRAERRAEAKALKAKAKLEAKFESKDRRKAAKERRKAEHKLRGKELKVEQKTAKKAAKADRKASKAQVKVAQAEAKTVAAKAKAAADAKPYSPASVRRYLTVGRLVAPIVAPVVYRAAVAARGRLSSMQAERVGVAPDVLRQFSGHGASLAARIATARTSLDKVAAQDTTADAKAFVDAIGKRLDNLAIAVDAAEAMATGQRRTAHRAIEDELGAIDADILARLGVRS